MTGFRIEDGVPWIGDRSFPWAFGLNTSEATIDGGRAWRQRGFHLMFETGATLSVQWGSGSYSSNHDAGLFGGEWHEESPDAEIAVWDKDNVWLEWPDTSDTVRGCCTPDEVLAVVDILASHSVKELAAVTQ